MSEEADKVQVNWHGKTLYLRKSKLDEFYENKSDEQKVDYINSHPDVREPVSVHRMNSKDRDLQEPEDLVLVRWSGQKVLLLERKQLDEWYHGSYEDHCEFVHKHPEAELK